MHPAVRRTQIEPASVPTIAAQLSGDAAVDRRTTHVAIDVGDGQPAVHRFQTHTRIHPIDRDAAVARLNASWVCRGAQISKLTDQDSFRRLVRGPSAWMLPLLEEMTICRAIPCASSRFRNVPAPFQRPEFRPYPGVHRDSAVLASVHDERSGRGEGEVSHLAELLVVISILCRQLSMNRSEGLDWARAVPARLTTKTTVSDRRGEMTRRIGWSPRE